MKKSKNQKLPLKKLNLNELKDLIGGAQTAGRGTFCGYNVAIKENTVKDLKPKPKVTTETVTIPKK